MARVNYSLPPTGDRDWDQGPLRPTPKPSTVPQETLERPWRAVRPWTLEPLTEERLEAFGLPTLRSVAAYIAAGDDDLGRVA